ncbi:MAG: GNAT family N-acetyltransferase [Candidatus Hodarchaeales archaeon]|jgi:sporulation protein YlmC with PRC-barrel domain/ribosomal protein S18 acetylase RimI-like enzyme
MLKPKYGHLASEILGYHIFDRHSKKIGKVSDLLINSHSYLVDYILVGIDRIIPVSFINNDDSMKKVITLSQAKDRIGQAFFQKTGSLSKKCYYFSEIKNTNVYDITGSKMGLVKNIAYHPGLRVDFLVGKPSIIDFLSPDYFIIPADFIGQYRKGSVVLSVSKEELSIINFSGFEQLFRKENDDHGDKKRYVIFEAPITTVSYYLSQKDEALQDVAEDLFIEELDATNDLKMYQFVNLFNLVLSSSPDTYIPLSIGDARDCFKQGTFLAYEHDEPIGYCCVTIEKQEETGQEIGAIAGIGVHPSKRGKKITLPLINKSLRYLTDKNVDVIQADIYELNIPSLRLFYSLGFREVGETYLV